MNTSEIIEICRQRDDKKETKVLYSPVIGWELYQWPEFKAFLNRLGVPFCPTTRLTISIGCEDIVKVVHHFYGQDCNTEGREVRI